MIKIINFPFCNFSAVIRMLKCANHSFVDFNAGDQLLSTDTLVLPGVGSFAEGMHHLNSHAFPDIIKKHASSGGKIIAICLGLQLLFESSDESPGVRGLGIFNGHVVKIPSSPDFIVPHIGWNSLTRTDSTPAFLNSFFNASNISVSDYYFVHSYYASPVNPSDSIATISHPALQIDVAFSLDNVFAFQFHPEKSGPSGYKLLDTIIRQ